MVSCAGLADWPNRIYVSCDKEENRYGAAAADGKTEKGQLKEVWCCLGVVGW
jgi:hypothetical protein